MVHVKPLKLVPPLVQLSSQHLALVICRSLHLGVAIAVRRSALFPICRRPLHTAGQLLSEPLVLLRQLDSLGLLGGELGPYCRQLLGEECISVRWRDSGFTWCAEAALAWPDTAWSWPALVSSSWLWALARSASRPALARPRAVASAWVEASWEARAVVELVTLETSSLAPCSCPGISCSPLSFSLSDLFSSRKSFSCPSYRSLWQSYTYYLDIFMNEYETKIAGKIPQGPKLFKLRKKGGVVESWCGHTLGHLEEFC